MNGERAGRVAGKVALITGAARGQGRAHALRFAAEGADLVLCDVGKAVERVGYALPTTRELDETAQDARDLGADVINRAVDVRDNAGLQALVDECRQALRSPRYRDPAGRGLSPTAGSARSTTRCGARPST